MRNYKTSAIAFFALTVFSSAGFTQATLEELVVTATKSESTVMDTAAAVTAISGEGLQSARANNIEGLSLVSPDLVVAGEGKSRMNLRIRGVGSYAFDIATDPGVIMVIDGIAQPRISTMTQNFNDVERLEILKGPQGALYGTNALGGIVNVVSKKATQEQMARLSIGAGTIGLVTSDLMIQGGVTDSVSARFNLQKTTDDGTMTETTYGNNNGADVQVAKLQFYGETDAGEWNASLSHTTLMQEAVISEPYFLCNSANPLAHYVLTPAVPGSTDFCTSLPAANVDGVQGAKNTANAIYADSIADPRAQELTTDGFNFTETINFGLNYQVDYDDYSLTALFGYQKANSGESRDFDSFVSDVMIQSHGADTETMTFELRVDSETDSGITWSAGLYAMQDEGTRSDNFSTGPAGLPHAFVLGSAVAMVNNANGTTLNPLANPGDTPAVIAAVNACAQSGTCAAYATPTQLRGNNFNGTTDLANFNNVLAGGRFDNIATVSIDTEVTAIFGSVKFPLADDLSLLLAGRYTDHSKPYTYTGATNGIGVILMPAPFDTGEISIEAEEFTPKATLEYVFDDSLAWFTYSNGYKIGSPSFAQWSAAVASVPSGDEEITMMEAGYKTTFGNGSQLELIYYDYDYDNKQNLLVAMGPTGPYGKLVFGDASISGLDVAFRTLLGPATKLSVAYAYIDGAWDDFVNDATYGANSSNPNGKQMAGLPLPFTADNNLSLSLEHVQSTELGDIAYTASYAYKDKYILFVEDYPGVVDVDPYSLLNFDMTLSTNEGYDLSLFCKNCLDEQYYNVALMLPRASGGGARNQLAQGRQIGVQWTSEF